MQYDAKMRDRIATEAKGKRVQSLDWSEECGGYWTMTFTDGSEISFRFMAELIDVPPAPRAAYNCELHTNKNFVDCKAITNFKDAYVVYTNG